MRKLLLLMLLLIAPAWAGVTIFYQSVSATQTNTTVTIPFPAATLDIVNDGPDPVFVDFGGDGVAATTDVRLNAGDIYTLTPQGGTGRATVLGIICDTSLVATVRIFARP
jgi:hypothetical protein